MNELRDPLVGDALRRLDVPDHAPDFWAALDVALRDQGGPERDLDDGQADDAGGADVIELHGSRRTEADRGPRARRLSVAAAAAAAAALAIGVGLPALQQAADGDAQVEMADGPSTSESIDTTPPDATLTTPETPSMTAAQAEANADEWLDRLVAGDVEGAYGLLDDTSRAAMPLDDFELLGAGLFEGAAGFAGDGIGRQVLQVETAAGFVSVVTYSGDLEREGLVETAAYPVVLTDTGVHFTLDGPELEIASDYADASGTTLTSPLVMDVGDDVPEVWVWTVGAGGDVMEPVEGRGRVEIDVEAAAGPGTHVVTLLAVQGDRLVARTHTVVVP